MWQNVNTKLINTVLGFLIILCLILLVVNNAKPNAGESLAVLNDQQPPVVHNVKDYTFYYGQDFDFKKPVVVRDDVDPTPRLKINNKINWTKAGTYSVEYVASDFKDNTMTYFSKVKIVKPKKIIYLTFDDGPSIYTKKLLKILKDAGVKATFFVTGNQKKFRYNFKDLVKAGHAIGVHTYTHDYEKVYSSEKGFFKDFDKIRKVIKDLTGVETFIQRFPGGASNTVSKFYKKGIMKKLLKDLHEKGQKSYDWNCMVGDADLNMSHSVKAETKAANSCSKYYKTVTLLTHDIYPNSVKAMKNVIKYYKKKGYVFLPITKNTPEILQKVQN
jgi:peptidoglycan/xylan/chitin deacetylase (PgdA/CDA1 family)